MNNKELKEEILDGGKDFKKFPEFKLIFEKHVDEYAFIPCGFADEKPFDKNHFLDILRESIKEEEQSKKKLKSKEEFPNKISALRDSRIKELELDKKSINLINVLSEFTYYKDYVRGCENTASYNSMNFFNYVADLLKINIEELKSMIKEELEEALNGKLDREVLKQRYESYAIYSKDGKKIIKIGEDADKLFKSVIEEEISEGKEELKGTCASAGEVTGEVRIIKKINDYKKGDKNFILVTGMTTPEFTAIVNKAKGIITDEGGITCHAAIISREFGIPCIVGTQNATKILKDGDIVELYATDGIVKVLKRK